MTREAIFAGYIPVIAHVERYECLSDISRIEDLQELGALIQVNACLLYTSVRHDVPEENIDVAWVPGAFEIPLIAKKMACLLYTSRCV